MRGLSTYGKFRVVLFLAMMGAILFGAGIGWAQGTGAAAPPAPEPTNAARGILELIFSHPDFVFFTIAGLSVIGVTLIIQGFMKFRQSVFMPAGTTNQIREMIEQRRFQELLAFTERDPSFISKALNPALKRAPSFSSMKEAMETAVAEQTAEQFRKIEYLNIIGNLGPLLGLLGTVLGMIQAFSALQAAGGNASPTELAGGISTALTHTFLGLMLAVPCLAAFGILRTIVDRLTVRGALQAEDLLLMIKPAEAKTQAPAARTGAAPIPAMPSPRKAPTVAPSPSPQVGL